MRTVLVMACLVLPVSLAAQQGVSIQIVSPKTDQIYDYDRSGRATITVSATVKSLATGWHLYWRLPSPDPTYSFSFQLLGDVAQGGVRTMWHPMSLVRTGSYSGQLSFDQSQPER